MNLVNKFQCMSARQNKVVPCVQRCVVDKSMTYKTNHLSKNIMQIYYHLSSLFLNMFLVLSMKRLGITGLLLQGFNFETGMIQCRGSFSFHWLPHRYKFMNAENAKYHCSSEPIFECTFLC